jgi:outer membrane protein OmpA-like peptidoglycan-associated protein
MQYLISHEVAKERFKIETYGERKPKTENDSQEGKQRNRRVEVSIWESWE